MIQNGQLIYVKEQEMIPVEEVKVGSVKYAGDGHYHQIKKIKKKKHRGITVRLKYSLPKTHHRHHRM